MILHTSTEDPYATRIERGCNGLIRISLNRSAFEEKGHGFSAVESHNGVFRNPSVFHFESLTLLPLAPPVSYSKLASFERARESASSKADIRARYMHYIIRNRIRELKSKQDPESFHLLDLLVE